jgi:pyruvate-ferredoxin/flavodoxin oxidoreductase
MALVAHLATLKASVPFVHFFEGFRLSHEVSKINVIDVDCIRPLVDAAKLARHRARAMNPNHPNQRGTAQGPDVFFQAMEAANSYYEETPDIVEEVFEQVAAVTGRLYK